MSKPREARLSGNDFNPERFVHQDEASTAAARPTCETIANRAYELYLTRGGGEHAVARRLPADRRLVGP